MALLRRVSRARRWSRQEWALLAEAWLALLAARLALRRWKLPVVLARLQPRSAQRASAAAPAMLNRAVLRAARLHALPMLCLPRSLALAWMVARRGSACELLIGAAPRDGTLDAHAWVELGGQPLNSPPNSAETHPILLRHPIHPAPAPHKEPS